MDFNSCNLSNTSDDFSITELFCTIEPIPFASPGTRGSSHNATSPLNELFLPAQPSPAHSSQRSYGQACNEVHSGVSARWGQAVPTSGARQYQSSNAIPLGSFGATNTIAEPILSKEEARRHKNREAAAKSQRRAHETIRALEDALVAVQQRHAFLRSELERLTLLRTQQYSTFV